ncbi:MAG TPA: nucleotidyltransferase domain-containing protein, partial [Casimicrobiaceae bacterium]|nr:nucleotidyltransferase domain-containing protein [Casimicrobiaceae bacterium]
MASADTATADAAAAPVLLAKRWRDELRHGREALREAFAAQPDTPRLLRGHARLVDRIVDDVFAALAAPPDIALVAVGGYGRGQLFPHSDVDVLILLPHALDAPGTAFIERFLGMLWDIGLEIGHSVRTIPECE